MHQDAQTVIEQVPELVDQEDIVTMCAAREMFAVHARYVLQETIPPEVTNLHEEVLKNQEYATTILVIQLEGTNPRIRDDIHQAVRILLEAIPLAERDALPEAIHRVEVHLLEAIALQDREAREATALVVVLAQAAEVTQEEAQEARVQEVEGREP